MRHILILFVLNLLCAPVFCQPEDSLNSSKLYLEFNPMQDEVYSYLKENLIYPEYAYKNKISGTVFVSFTVDANRWVKNKVTNVHVVRGVHPSLDFAAVSLVRGIPDLWLPPARGVSDTVRFIYPAKYNLETVKAEQVSAVYERRIQELLTMDSLALHSLLYVNKPVAREAYVPPPPAKGKERTEAINTSDCIQIAGTVMELPANHPLPQVLVREVGTDNFVLTDIDGEFSLCVRKKSEVKFSCLGYTYSILKFRKNTAGIEVFLERDGEELYFMPAD